MKEVSYADEKLQCFFLFQILTCLTSHMYRYQSSGVRIRDMAPIFCCYLLLNKNKQCGCSNVLRKIQILKCWLTANYSKCIIWGHSIITLPQIDQNLDTLFPLICTCLILILNFYSYPLQLASVNTKKDSLECLLLTRIQTVLISRHGLQISF